VATRAHSEGFSAMWVWIGRVWEAAREPRAERSGGEQEGAKRGVRIGVRRVWEGSRALIWLITAWVSAMAWVGEGSR